MITPEEFACRTNETQINGLEPETSTIDMAHYIGTVEGQPGGASMIISKDSVPSGQVSKAAGKGKLPSSRPFHGCKRLLRGSANRLSRFPLACWCVFVDGV